MKKIILSTLSLFMLLCILVSCVSQKSPDSTDTSSDRLSAIESQLASLLAEKNDSTPSSTSDDSTTPESQESTSNNNSDNSDTKGENPSRGFKYETNGDTATITGYIGDEENLVIPTSIDGYRITAIGDNAFQDMRIKSVIISNGVESIGWFAFDGCTRLGALTVPSSVKKIGYSAFGGAEASITIYCHEGSFAQKYAKSYGLTYAII